MNQFDLLAQQYESWKLDVIRKKKVSNDQPSQRISPNDEWFISLMEAIFFVTPTLS